MKNTVLKFSQVCYHMSKKKEGVLYGTFVLSVLSSILTMIS